MKNLSKLSAFLIALALLLPLTACSDGTNGDDTVTTAAPAPVQTEAVTAAAPDDGWVEIRDDIPESVDFGGREFVMLIREGAPYENEFNVFEDNGAILDTAVFRRNMAVEEKLGVELTMDARFGNFSQSSQFNSLVNNSVKAGNHTWDAVAAYACGTMKEVLNGTYQNLLGMEYLNFDKGYWNASVAEQFTVKGRLFTMTGAISPQLIGQAVVFFENLGLAKDYGIENVYELVKNGEWTNEKLMSLIQNVYVDSNMNNKPDKEDTWGMTLPLNAQVDAFYASYNCPITERSADGELVFAFDPDRVLYVYDKLYSLLCGNPAVWAKNDYADDIASDYLKLFSENKALFTINRLYTVTTNLADMENDYAILPYPMCDKDQGGYRTYAWDQYSMVSVPNDASDPAVSGAVLEAMSAESYNTVTPAYYETALKYRYSRDADSSIMLDIITENIQIEFCYLFSGSVDTIYFLREQIRGGTPSISSVLNAKRKAWAKTFDNAIDGWPQPVS